LVSGYSSRFGPIHGSLAVIGERLVTPSSIVFLVVKLRIALPRHSASPPAREKDAEETKRILKMNDEMDHQFLVSKKDTEDELSADASGWAHAPYWPGVCHSSFIVA
jgi:translocation protein SEC63